MQKMLTDYIENEEELVEKSSTDKGKKPLSILEQINDMKIKKEGEDWGYKDDPKNKGERI